MSSIVTSPNSQQELRRNIQLQAVDDHLNDDEIHNICRGLGHHWRERTFTPAATLRSCVHRALNGDHSIAAMLADLAAGDWPDEPIPTDSAWCQARCRLPLEVFQELIARRARDCQQRFGKLFQWHGRPVFIVDGSTVSMPDEPELVEEFGYANTKHGPSRFPVGRVTFIELMGLECIWDYRLDDYRTSEDAQFIDMWPSLPDGCIVLVDKKFGSFYMLAKLRHRDIGMITLLHEGRNPHKLIRKGVQLGPSEWIVYLDLAPQLRKKYDDPSLPELLPVRLIRVRFRRGRRRHTLWIVTTLMDTMLFPRRLMAAGYRRRWDIEPRMVKRDRRRYPYLKEPRAVARERCLT